jgi:hypothetical protein
LWFCPDECLATCLPSSYHILCQWHVRRII